MALPLHDDSGLETVPLWIDGTGAASSQGHTFPVYSAKQQKNVFMAQSASTDDAAQAAVVALKAFSSWKHTSASHRRDLLLRAADIFQMRKAEVIRLQVEETSCEPGWAGFNVGYGLTAMREIAASITSVFGEMPRMASEASLCLVFKEPIGPSLLIAP